MKPAIMVVFGVVIAAVLVAGIWQVQRLQSDIAAVGRQIHDRPAEPAATGQASAARSSNSRLAEDVNEINNAVRALSERFGELRERVDRLADSVRRSTAGSRTAPQQAGSTQEQPRLSQQEQVALLESTLNDTTEYDEIWSNDTTVSIEELVRTEPAYQVAESTNVQCGGTLCKIEAVLPAGAEQHEKDLFEVKLAMDLASELPRANIVKRTEPDGSVRYLFYMARQGYKLPTEGGGRIDTSQSQDDGER